MPKVKIIDEIYFMEFKELQGNYIQTGRLEGISIRSQRLEPVRKLDQVNAIADCGLEGDHYSGPGGTRQVTLIQREHLQAVSRFMGSGDLDFTCTRRNLEVSGINLLSFKGKKFLIGKVVLEYSGECHPCSRMEQGLGLGGYNAMRGHGGITAKIVSGGEIRIGDSVAAFEEPTY